MLLVYVEAPFAAFRTFTAGWYRPTATFITPSAAYGLLLNVAGIETRLREGEEGHDGNTPASLIRDGLPAATVALGVAMFRLCSSRRVPVMGADVFPRVQTVYQQLHNYPVGKGNKVDDPENPGQKIYQGDVAARRSGGNKYNITPVRREFLSDVRAVIAVRTDADTEDLIRRGLSGDPPGTRYGVPFLGDNAFLIDRLELLTEAGPVRWYEKVSSAGDFGPRERTTRLTVLIDRGDLSRTSSALFTPVEPSNVIPETAWVEIVPPNSAVTPKDSRKKS
jgi:CRISPR-associated protein Cas5t